MAIYGYVCGVPGVTPADEQRNAIRAHCDQAGLVLDAEFHDSGDETWREPWRERDAGRRLLAKLAPGDAVVIATPLAASPTLTGFARLTAALAEFGATLRLCGAGAASGAQAGRALRAVTSSPVQTAQTLGALSRSERVRVGLAFARAAGRRTSKHPPIGFRFVRRGRRWHLKADDYERKVVARIVAWRQAGHSWAKIASNLLRNKVPTSTSGTWSTRRVRRAYAAVVSGQLQVEAPR